MDPSYLLSGQITLAQSPAGGFGHMLLTGQGTVTNSIDIESEILQVSSQSIHFTAFGTIKLWAWFAMIQGSNRIIPDNM
jgi:hypothetical protein